jgi:quercetin dioxygenase-like cupin family protein
MPRSHVVIFITHRSVYTFIGKYLISRSSYGGKPIMTKILPPSITKVRYLRISADETGGSHFDTVAVEQSLAAGAPPAAPFYVSKDGPASKHRFYTFQPGWIGDWHPCPTRQFLALMSGEVEMETTDGTKKRFKPGDLVLLEDTTGKGHVTRNIGDGYAAYLVVPVPER